MAHSGNTVKDLSQAERALALAVIMAAKDESPDVDERFFERIRTPLDGLCEAIANHVPCTSVAAFFVDQSDKEQFLQMRGACGNLRWVLDASHPDQGRFPGGVRYARPPGADCQAGLCRVTEDQACLCRVTEDQVRSWGWSLTQKAWLLGHAYIANTRGELDFLGGREPDQPGVTDEIAYRPDQRGWAMRHLFRSLLCIPVFARGQTARRFCLPGEESHDAFLQEYHVVGLIKLEGRLPHVPSASDWDKLLDRPPYAEDGGRIRRRVEEWLKGPKRDLAALIGGAADSKVIDGRPRPLDPELAEANRRLLAQYHDPNRPDGRVIDFLTEALGAQFTWDDAEVTVAIAMQLGRVLGLRVIQWADRWGILLNETDIGRFDIRHNDIRPLRDAIAAADSVCCKVHHELSVLEHRREDAHKAEWEALRPGQAHELPPTEWTLDTRRKDLTSLLAKVARKQSEKTEREPNGGPRQGPDRLDLELPLHDHRPQAETQDGGPSRTPPRGLVHRIMRDYKVDDLAGVRVVCPYLSDVVRLLDHMQAHFPSEGIHFSRKEDVKSYWDDPRGGYRAIHLTVSVEVDALLSPDDTALLRQALGIPDGKALRFPCEIQLRTAYQHSWSQASHELTYKRAAIPPHLEEHQRILSELLYQADRTADLVRAGIARAFEGEDCGRRQLLEHLDHLEERSHDKEPDSPGRFTLGDKTLVQFAMRCAQLLYADKFRLGGKPHLAHAIAVARVLAEDFGLTDSGLLAAGLLHDMWMDRQYQSGETAWQDVLDDRCGPVLSEFGARLCLHPDPSAAPADETVAAPDLGLDDLMEFLRQSWIQLRTSEAGRSYRVRALTGGSPAYPFQKCRTRTRARFLECAIVASRFAELTLDPNAQRALAHFEENHRALQRLLRPIGGEPEGRQIERSCEWKVREAARELGITTPIDWAP